MINELKMYLLLSGWQTLYDIEGSAQWVRDKEGITYIFAPNRNIMLLSYWPNRNGYKENYLVFPTIPALTTYLEKKDNKK